MTTLEIVDKNRNFNEYCKMLLITLKNFLLVYQKKVMIDMKNLKNILI